MQLQEIRLLVSRELWFPVSKECAVFCRKFKYSTSRLALRVQSATGAHDRARRVDFVSDILNVQIKTKFSHEPISLKVGKLIATSEYGGPRTHMNAFIYNLFTLPQKIELYSVEWKMIGEWWIGNGKKLSWPNLRYSPSICLDGLRKNTKYCTSIRITGLQAYIWSRDLQNTKQEWSVTHIKLKTSVTDKD
jgi:hypothetical protein